MPHADDLLLSRDEPLDPAAELFVEDHLRGCARCRDLQHKVERADRLIAAPERATDVPPRHAAPARSPLGRLAVASGVVVMLVIAAISGSALRTVRDRDVEGQVAAPGGPSPTFPRDWQLVIARGALIPLPPGWRMDID